MTATHAYYLVAYPHPSIPPAERIKRLKLDSEVDGEALLGLLKSTYPDHSDDLKRATLWKASDLPYKDVDNDSDRQIFEWIRRNDPGVTIWPFQTVGFVFPGGPHEKSKTEVDVVIMTPEIVEAMDSQRDADGNLKHMRARIALSRTMGKTSSPSESAEDPTSVRDAVVGPTGPRYGRPSDRFGPPTALFSPELALLKHDLDHLDALVPDEAGAALASSLIKTAAGFFDEEIDRQMPLRPVLTGLLTGRSQWLAEMAGTSVKPEAVWLQGLFTYMIIEIKNESGLGGDPFVQGLVLYSKLLSDEKYSPFLGRSNLPLILLTIAGSRLVISTAIFTDSIYADELLSIKLCFGPHASDNVFRAARKSWKKHPLDATGKALWPNPTANLPELAEATQGLEFFCKVDRSLGTPINRTLIDEDNKRHAIYLARMKTEDGTSTVKVLVKFAAKYNEAAHLLLADHKPPLAPTLHSCTPVVGEMFMVVMQYVPGASLFNTPMLLPTSAQEVVRRDVSKALKLLHGADFVFGDLREANVLYLPEDGGRALLIDFDNVGRDGEDRYSACLNLEVGLGVSRLQIMEKSHDVRNLERLTGRVSREL